MDYSIILLAYNEEKNIKQDIKNLSSIINDINHLKKKIETVIVLDKSNDNSFLILDSLKGQYKFNLIYNKKRIGYRQSILKGLENAKGKNIVLCETGQKYNFKEIKEMIISHSKNRIYSGYRINRKDEISRRFLTFCFNLYTRIIFQHPYRDLDSGLKIIPKKIFINYFKNKCKFENFCSTELMLKLYLDGFKIYEKKVSYFQRPDKSKQFSFLKIIFKSSKVFLDLLKFRFRE